MLLPTEENKQYRIALLGIYHESNTFIGRHTSLADFKSSRWHKGAAIITEYADAHHELGGAIEVFQQHPVELLPVFYAETTPGGRITAEAFSALTDELLRGLTACLPVDACFVVPHGAAVSESHADMDGCWLAMVREKIGDHIPIVGTLDPHANVSPLMIECTDGLFPYQTNPHVDQRETGRKAARFLLDLLDGKISPHQRLLQAPLAISIDQQHTAVEPCQSLYAFARDLENKEGIIAINIVLGFPYADVPEMGTSAIIISETPDAAFEAENLLIDYFNRHASQFGSDGQNPSEQIAGLTGLTRPILLLDMGDNVGAGADGNSTWLVGRLEKTHHKFIACVYDPQAVATTLSHREGDLFSLSFGIDPETGDPFTSKVTFRSVHAGTFNETAPRHGGQNNYDMGRSTVVVTEKGNWILLHSKRVPPFSLAQLTSCDINPEAFDAVIAKGVNAPIAAYEPVCRSIVRVNTPGPTQATMELFDFKYRRKPLFPFEKILS